MIKNYREKTLLSLPANVNQHSPENFYIKETYKSREEIQFFNDINNVTDESIWQPLIYPFAYFLAKENNLTTIIDLGCGSAYKLQSFRNEFEVIGVDIMDNIQYCRTHYDWGKWIEYNIEDDNLLDLNGVDLKVSLVICSDVIEHLKNPLTLLNTLKELLIKVPFALISTPERDLARGVNDFGPPKNTAHIREWNFEELNKLFISNNFRVVYSDLTCSNTIDYNYKTTFCLLKRNKTDGKDIANYTSSYLDNVNFTKKISYNKYYVELINKQSFNLFHKAQSKLKERNFDAASKLITNYKDQVNYKSFLSIDQRIKKNTSVSVIIVAYNTKQDLVSCIQSVFDQNCTDYEVIIVDNGFNDEVLTEIFSFPILYINPSQNLLLSEGRNIGVYYAKSELVAFLDDDAIVPSNYISSIKQTFKKYDVFAARGKVLPKTNNKNNKVAHHYDLGNIATPDTIQTEGNSVFRKEIYNELNGMNPLLFGGEGTELSYKIAVVYGHYSTIYSPEIIIYHDYAITDDKLNTKTLRHQLMRDFSSYLHPQISDYIKQMQSYHRDEITTYYSEADIPRKEHPSEDIFISICIITYNSEKYILEAVKSALAQTYQNFEIVIVDDGSEDNTEKIIAELNSRKIKYISQIHQGAPIARNRAIEESSGSHILWLDSDDILLPRTLENYVNIIKKYPQAYIFYGDLFIIDHNKNYKNKFAYTDYYEKKDELYSKIIHSSPIPNVCTLINKKLFEIIGNYNKSFPRAHDYEFWSRAIRYTEFKHVNKFVGLYRWHDNNLSGRNKKPDRSFEIRIIEKLLNDYSLSRFINKKKIDSKDKAKFLFQLAKKFEQYENLDKSKEYALQSLTYNQSKIVNSYLVRINSLIKLINNKKSPLISICIPTYNRAKYIANTIRSALNQDYNHYEIVIVDDGSTDNTNEIVKKFNSEKLHYIYKENTGAPDTRNRCINEAKGDYILWLDSDDMLVENILATYVETLYQYPNADVFYGELKSIGKSNYHYRYNDWYGKNDAMIQFLLTGTPMPHPGALVRKEVYYQLGNYNIAFKRAHDYEFWSRLALAEIYTCKYIPKVTCLYMIHNHNLTGEFDNNTDYKYEAEILKNILDKKSIKELFPNSDWETNGNLLTAEFYLKISIKFLQWQSIEYAIKYLLLSLEYDFNETQRKFIDMILLKQSISEAYPKLCYELNEKFKKLSSTTVLENNDYNPIFSGKEGNLRSADALNHIANTAFHNGDLEKAHEYFAKELELAPNSSRACLGLAETFFAAELFEEAKTMYEWTIKNGDNRKEIWDKLSIANTKLGLDPKNSSLDLSPVETTLTLQDAEELINKSDLTGAEKILMQLLEKDNQATDVLNDLAVIKIMQNNLEEALNYINKVIQIDPQNEIAIENLKYIETQVTP